ncbi:MAG: radical SAM/SPASM domain-containing protein [Polyangiales bacterium]
MMRARIESFGAWIRTDDRTLIAVDRNLARRIGLEGGEAWSGEAAFGESLAAPLEAHVAVTARCPAACGGCYLDAKPEGEHRAFEELCRTIDELAARGVFTLAFGGGEPLTHPRLGELATHARSRGLVPVVTTSGIGLTEARARTLSSFAQVNVSHDGVDGGYEAVRGFSGEHVAERAIGILREAGIPVGANLVLTRASFSSLEASCDRLASLGAREVQLLRYKPAGRAASLDYLAKRLAREQVAELPSVIRRIVDRGRISLRIDCAMVPLVAGGFSVADLLALGVMGCEAGRGLAAVDVHGRESPCSFTRGQAPDAYRDYAKTAPEPCASCPIRAVCRGGCRVVAEHLGDVHAPDPECPRVLAG